MAAEKQKQENAKELEILKSIGILKAEVAKGVLAEPGKSWKDIPPQIFDGMGIVDQTQDQLMVHAMHSQQDDDQQQTAPQPQQPQQPQQGQPEQAQQPQQAAA